MTNISQSVGNRLFQRAWEDCSLATEDAIDNIITQIMEKDKQYFTAEEIIELLTQHF